MGHLKMILNSIQESIKNTIISNKFSPRIKKKNKCIKCCQIMSAEIAEELNKWQESVLKDDIKVWPSLLLWCYSPLALEGKRSISREQDSQGCEYRTSRISFSEIARLYSFISNRAT